MPLVSGKIRPPAVPVVGKGPLDEALPNVRYLKPSLLWSVASHIPLVVAILIGRFAHKLRVVTYTTQSANLMVREIGIVLFLASVGIEAGANFLETVVNGDGLLYVGCGFVITIVPLLIIGAIARMYFKVNYFMLMGLIAGSNTDPPALAYSNQATNSDAPAVGYSTVYPLSMFLRILSGQMILLLMM